MKEEPSLRFHDDVVTRKTNMHASSIGIVRGHTEPSLVTSKSRVTSDTEHSNRDKESNIVETSFVFSETIVDGG